MTRSARPKQGDLAARIHACTLCPRLVAHREEIGRVKRRAYRDQVYWARPVAGFGDPRARLVIVGLAPGAHGANRTGRAFTGDKSGEFLYAALHRVGAANQPLSIGRDDGLTLDGVFITLPVRCVPPDNRPSPGEIAACRPWFLAELATLGQVRAVLALGAIAYASVLDVSKASDAPRFAHGARSEVPWPYAKSGQVGLFASYHVSQQNTQTGRLTEAMFDEILRAALEHGGGMPDRSP